jgi:hypothetical protein
MRWARGKAHGAAETQLEAQLDEFVGLLPAAVEGMRNAAGHGTTAKMLEHLVDGPSYMQQDRQIGIARNFKLGAEPEFLAGIIARLDEAIEPDFADRQRLFALNGFTQGIEVRLAGAIDIHRMNAVGRPAAGVVPAYRSHGAEIRALHGWHHDIPDTDGRGRVCHGTPIGIELGRIEMAVGVDQHA